MVSMTSQRISYRSSDSLEERVLQSLLCSGSVTLEPSEHRFHQVDSLYHILLYVELVNAKERRQIRHRVDLLAFGKDWKDLGVNHCCHLPQVLFGWIAKHSNHLKELKALRISREHQRQSEELKHYAGCGPDVDGEIVEGGAKDELRCSVVATDCVGGVLVSLQVQKFGRPKVTNFHLTFLEQHILRFEVSVADAHLVHVVQASEELFHESLYLLHGHLSLLFLMVSDKTV